MSDVLMKLPIVMSSVKRRIRPRESSRCCADTRLQTECCLFQQRGHLTMLVISYFRFDYCYLEEALIRLLSWIPDNQQKPARQVSSSFYFNFL